jgi:hypothetical protein
MLENADPRYDSNCMGYEERIMFEISALCLMLEFLRKP